MFMVLHQIAVQNLKRVVEAAKKVILVQDVNFASMMNALQYLKVSMEQLIQKLVKESGVVSMYLHVKNWKGAVQFASILINILL